MYDPYTNNPFRVLGLPAEVEPALLPTWMDPNHLPPQWKLSWLVPPDRSAEAVERAMAALKDPETLKLHYRTWFRKETPTDQKAIKACEDGYWEGAADLWKGQAEAGDESALQNMAVLYHSRALSSSLQGNPVWAYWTRALDWWNKLVLKSDGEAVCIEAREKIIEDLIKLAHEQASRDSPEDVRLVLDIFRRAGMPEQRREQLESELLSLELARLKHLCNKVRETMPNTFRVGNPGLDRAIEQYQRTLDNEIYPAMDWLRKAQPDGKLQLSARKEVSLLLRSLSRAVRGRLGSGDMGFMDRAVEIAPEGFHEELLRDEEPQYAEDPGPGYEEEEEAPPPARRGMPRWVMAVVFLLVAAVGVGGYVAHRRSIIAQKRAALIKQLDGTASEAAQLASQLAPLESELVQQERAVAVTRKQLQAKPADAVLKVQLGKQEARLRDVKARRDQLKKQHQALRDRMDQLKGELSRTK
ncbi:MAG: hypothetical protein AB1758_15230 [Candidatus Eremiobacterota bacterium]